ncbi:MBL fold metallo-hydrolase [Clostridium estertheticum]|uniref:MBL fold metallo-hydrolase n=1 Tax=Clostridium estertheticum TaxID=238834 RepID=UPI001C0DC402|nr:MBL fold metallo-hydrolase [Clostridium estertheticum]MBU3175183.1 MBL fold metallo-hydrolase [Clostridium estertheticum]
MFKIYNIYVGQGDCFLIVMEEEPNMVDKDEEEKAKKYFTILVDGGFAKYHIYKKVKEILAGKDLNVIVVTHVDQDHISGIKQFINKKDLNLEKTVILFNKFDKEVISYRDGEKLFDKIQQNCNENLLLKSYSVDFIEENKKLKAEWSAKNYLDCKFYSVGQRKKVIKIDNKVVSITVLGPEYSVVSNFMKNWKDDITNSIITNKSSIVILIEYKDYRILMLGDAYLRDVKKSMEKLKDLVKKIDLIKVSHHGARDNNEGLWEFAKEYDCKKFMITIDEKQEDEKNHPNRELINAMPTCFNISCGKAIKCDEIDVIQYKEEVEL